MHTKIRFFILSTGATANPNLDYFIRQDGTVWRDNNKTCESQCSVVGFEDFIMECDEVGWEII